MNSRPLRSILRAPQQAGLRSRGLDGTYPITAIAVHPQSGPFPYSLCRREQIGRYWSGLVEWPNPGAFTIIGGDWNTDDCYDDHPRADGGEGMDHRQILVDLTLPR